jgi:hypothetical protein
MDGTCCGLRPIYAAACKVGLTDACIPEPAALDQPWRPNSVPTIGSRPAPSESISCRSFGRTVTRTD